MDFKKYLEVYSSYDRAETLPMQMAQKVRDDISSGVSDIFDKEYSSSGKSPTGRLDQPLFDRVRQLHDPRVRQEFENKEYFEITVKVPFLMKAGEVLDKSKMDKIKKDALDEISGVSKVTSTGYHGLETSRKEFRAIKDFIDPMNPDVAMVRRSRSEVEMQVVFIWANKLNKNYANIRRNLREYQNGIENRGISHENV